MSEPVAARTLVLYHGSLEFLTGEEFTVFDAWEDSTGYSDDGFRYTLIPVVEGLVDEGGYDDYIWNVRHQSFTVVNQETSPAP